MKRVVRWLMGLGAMLSIAVFAHAYLERRAIVAASIAAYQGPCACPYSVMRDGRRCGGSSA